MEVGEAGIKPKFNDCRLSSQSSSFDLMIALN